MHHSLHPGRALRCDRPKGTRYRLELCLLEHPDFIAQEPVASNVCCWLLKDAHSNITESADLQNMNTQNTGCLTRDTGRGRDAMPNPTPPSQRAVLAEQLEPIPVIRVLY